MGRRLMDLLNELDPTPATSGELIRAIRRNFCITLKEVEMLTRIREPNLSAIENNKIELTKHYAELLAAAFGTHPASLLFPNGEDYKTKEMKAIERKAEALRKKKKKSA